MSAGKSSESSTGSSRYSELIKIDDDLERSFYEKEAVSEKWGVRELQRQMETALFLRLAASRDKEGILSLVQEGIEIQTPEDVIKKICQICKWELFRDCKTRGTPDCTVG